MNTMAAAAPALPAHRVGTMRARTRKELILFFVLTMAMMYALCFTVVLFNDPLKAFSDSHLGGLDPGLLLYPAAYSPTLIALLLTWRFGGRTGLRRLMKNIFRWRVGIAGWLLAFLFFPTIWAAVAIIRHFATGAPTHWSSWYSAFPLLVLSTYLLTDTGGLGEETGWRGYALPRLLEGFTPTTAGLIVGFFFGVWHLPGWFLSNLHYAQKDFACFVGWTMMISVMMSYLFVRLNGSVLLAGIIPHMVMNITGEDRVKLYEDNWQFLGYFALAAFILVTLASRRMFAPPPFEPCYSPQYYTEEEERAAMAEISRRAVTSE